MCVRPDDFGTARAIILWYATAHRSMTKNFPENEINSI